MADENKVLENKAQLREARMKGKASGFRWGAIVTAAAAAVGSIALHKAGINVSDKLAAGYDDVAAKVRKASADAKKKLAEKKEAKEKEEV